MRLRERSWHDREELSTIFPRPAINLASFEHVVTPPLVWRQRGYRPVQEFTNIVANSADIKLRAPRGGAALHPCHEKLATFAAQVRVGGERGEGCVLYARARAPRRRVALARELLLKPKITWNAR